MITTWSEGDEAIRREQEADAREAMRDACTLRGDPIEGEPDEFWTPGGEFHRAHPGCSEAWAGIVGDHNTLSILEIRGHRREVIEGGTVIRYEQRLPGERHWTLVEIFRLTEPDELPGWTVCDRCHEPAPIIALRHGACQTCRCSRIA